MSLFNMPIGGGAVNLTLNTSQWNSQVSRALGQLRQFPQRHPVQITPQLAAFSAGMGRAQAQVNALQAATANFQRTASRAGGFGGFGAGVASSLTGRFAASPQMAIGEMLGTGAKAAVTTAIDLEKQFGTLGRVAELSAADVAKLKQEIFAIGAAKGGTSISELIDIATTGARGGVGKDNPKDLMAFTEGMGRLKSVMPEMEVGKLADDTLRILNVFKLGADRAEGFGSALVKLDNDSVASASDILDMTQRMSGLASQMGVTLPQVMALAATMRSVGLAPESGASAFNRILGKMMADPEKLAGTLGLDAGKFKEGMRANPLSAFQEVLGQLGAQGGSMEKASFLRDELGLKNVRDIAMMTQLGSKFPDVSRRAGLAATETGTLGALNDADARRAEETWMALGKLQNQATILADEIGQSLLPMIKDAAGGLGGMAGILRSLGGGGAGALVGAARGVGALNPLGMAADIGQGKAPTGGLFRMLGLGDRMGQAGQGLQNILDQMGLGGGTNATEAAKAIDAAAKRRKPLAAEGEAPAASRGAQAAGEREAEAAAQEKARAWQAERQLLQEQEMEAAQEEARRRTERFNQMAGVGSFADHPAFQSQMIQGGMGDLQRLQEESLSGPKGEGLAENSRRIEMLTRAVEALDKTMDDTRGGFGKPQSNPLAVVGGPD